MKIFDFILLILLYFASKEDVKDHMVSDKYTFTFTAICILQAFTKGIIIVPLVCFILAMILYFKDYEILRKIGVADIIIYLGFLAKYEFINLPTFLLIPNLLALIYYMLEKKIIKKSILIKDNAVPMFPFFLISMILFYI